MNKVVSRTPMLGAALVGSILLSAQSAVAQTEIVPPDRERMTEFVRAHLAVNDARDEFHGKIGRLHDEQGRERARQELEEQIDDILEGAAMTREEYDQLILLISLDGDMRSMFDEIVRQLEEEGLAPFD